MKKVDFETTTYRVSETDTLYIDIVINKENSLYEAYIYDINYFIKLYMFGMETTDVSYKEFYNMTVRNYKDYIESLREY